MFDPFVGLELKGLLNVQILKIEETTRQARLSQTGWERGLK